MMKRNFNTILRAGMALSMGAMLLAGCGSSNGGNAANDSQQAYEAYSKVASGMNGESIDRGAVFGDKKDGGSFTVDGTEYPMLMEFKDPEAALASAAPVVDELLRQMEAETMLGKLDKNNWAQYYQLFDTLAESSHEMSDEHRYMIEELRGFFDVYQKGEQNAAAREAAEVWKDLEDKGELTDEKKEELGQIFAQASAAYSLQ